MLPCCQVCAIANLLILIFEILNILYKLFNIKGDAENSGILISCTFLFFRKEAGRDFAWNRPIAGWVCCIVSSFAGSLIANPLLGRL